MGDRAVSERPAGEVLPGSPSPLGALWDGTGTNFALWSAGAHGRRPLPVRRRRHRAPAAARGDDPPGVARPAARRRARASATATGCTAPTTRSAGLRYNPAKLLLDPYTRAVDGGVTLHPSLFGYAGDAVDGGARDDQDSAPYVPRGVVVHDPFPWDGDRPLRTSWSDTVIYEVHVKGATARHPDVPPHLRGTYAGLAHPAFVEHLQSLGRDRRRTAAGAPLRQRAAPDAPRPDQLLGLQHPRLLRAARRLQLLGQRRRPGARVQDDGQGAARRRHRGDPRRRLQPHRRGRPHRADPVVQGHRQPRLLPARRRQPRPLHRLHRLREHPRRPPSRRPGAAHGLAALLGHRDARRRVPLRPRLRAGPLDARRRPAVGLLRRRPPGPGGQPGQADRRALGRRPGRLPGRQLPAAVDGVERQVPRHRPRRLVRRARRRPRPRLPADRLVGPVPLRRPPPVRQHQLRHRPRRLHDGRPGHLRAQAQRGQRRGQPGRREPQPQLELRRRGAHRPTPRSPRCGRGRCATTWPRCCCRPACRC